MINKHVTVPYNQISGDGVVLYTGDFSSFKRFFKMQLFPLNYINC